MRLWSKCTSQHPGHKEIALVFPLPKVSTGRGIGGNIGAQVMGLAMAGGSASVSANYGRHTSTTTGNEQLVDNNLSFSYSQEEKISVSPGTRVKARITTYSVRYEQKYTLKFSIDSTLNVPLTYKTRCQQTCFGKNIGYVMGW